MRSGNQGAKMKSSHLAGDNNNSVPRTASLAMADSHLKAINHPLVEWARRPTVRAFALIGLCFLVYAPALRAGFVWDDDTMLTANPLIHAADGLRRIWFTTQPADYWPVTYTSLWLEWRCWGLHAAGYHAINILLHAGTVVLLWILLRHLKIPGAFLAAALFAVHPVNVESVAWIAQRKELLATLFFLASLLGFGRTGRRWHAWSLLLFLFGLLSKGTVAVLPVVLLILILRHRRLRWSDVWSLAPFFLLAAASVAVNVWFQRHGSSEIIRAATPWERICGAGAVVWFYLGKALLPAHLTFFYPTWQIQAGNPLWWLPTLAGAALTLWLWRRRHAPGFGALCWTWLYFVAALVPVMGLTDVYFMRFSLVADHYEHLALLGVVALAGAAGSEWERHRSGESARPSPLGPAVAVALVACLGALTWRQCGSYRDLATLYSSTLEKNPDAWIAQCNWGALLQDQGRWDEAQVHLEQALRLHPDYPEAEHNLALGLAHAGRFQEAIPHYETALRLKPRYPVALSDLGNALVAVGRAPEAVTAYETALLLRPDEAEFHYNLALDLARLGRGPEAVRQYDEALRLLPDYPEARYGRGVAEAAGGDLAGAVRDYLAALQLRPDYAEVDNDLGVVLARLGRPSEAMDRLETALRLRPDLAQAHHNLGLVLSHEGRFNEAIGQYRAALKLQPDYWEAHYALGLAWQAVGKPREAEAEFRAAAKAGGGSRTP
jgi:tetratricopeptide (TPR) repeat protein